MTVKGKYSETGPAGKVSHQYYGKVMRKDARLAGTSSIHGDMANVDAALKFQI
jgi:hypothetical protein